MRYDIDCTGGGSYVQKPGIVCSKGSSALVVLVQPFERVAIDYFKSRLVDGGTFVVPSDLAQMATTEVATPCTLSLMYFQESSFQPRSKVELAVGSVVFKVVNARPEARKVFKTGASARVSSTVVVRAFGAVRVAGLVPAAWSLVR